MSYMMKLLKIELLILKLLYKLLKQDRLLLNIDGKRRKIYEFQGVTLGENSLLIDCSFSTSSKGDKFKIGNNTTCTGVKFLGHDASPSLYIKQLQLKERSVLKGSRRSYRKPIVVGDNVFIGHGTILLPGTIIENNCIVAAGSVVMGTLTSNSVYAGNPVKKVKELHQYISKYEKLLDDYPELF